MSILTDAARNILKPELESLRSQNAIESNNLQERLAQLELALEDVGWMRVLYGEGDQEFSRGALGTISTLSRIMYLKNPLINRGVNVKRYYVWGQGVTIKSKDPDVDQVIQQFLKDRKNQVELTGHTAQMTKELDLECDGNIFLVFFPKMDTGRVRMRSIPFAQITEIITNPEDAKEPWYYHRMWTDGSGKAQDCFYPDWCYNPKSKPKKHNGKSIEWNSPVMHIKIGGFSDWRFGVSEVYSAIDWARAYKEFLEDWATITRAYARFAWQATTKGGAKGVAAVRTKFQTGITGTTGENNPPPVAGAMAITGEGTSLTPIRTAGATTSPEDGRRIMLMVVSGLGLPETFFGDVSVGSLATATSLDRPTELNMIDRQTFWHDVLMDILNYVLLWAVKTGNPKIKAQLIPSEDGNGIEQLKWPKSDFQDIVKITFPAIIEGNVAENVAAVVNAATLGGQLNAEILDPDTLLRMLLTALGETDIEATIDQMQNAKTEQEGEWVKTAEVFLEKYFRKGK